MELRKNEAGTSSKLLKKLTDVPFTKKRGYDFLVTEPEALSNELGSKPLAFTFIPSVRRLPAHFQIVKPSKVTFAPAEEPKRDRSKEIVSKTAVFSDHLVLGSGAMQDSPSHRSHSNQQERECTVSKAEEMPKNDVYQAEFVMITDSDGEGEIIARNNVKQPMVIAVITDHRQARIQSLDGPWDSTGKTYAAEMTTGAQSVSKHHHNELRQQKQSQEYKIKSSYKALAAIPTNTLLLEQKALDEPVKTLDDIETDKMDTHSQLYSPAQLRQQTEEVCAAIDKVLQEPLPMHHHDIASTSPQGLDIPKMAMTVPKAAGRETRYAVLCSPVPTSTKSQMTKPGVIHSVPLKAKIMLKKEEGCRPNPFKKYVEGTSESEMQHLRHSTTWENKSELRQYDGNGRKSKGTCQRNERTPYSRQLLLIREDMENTSAKQSKGKK
uniref:Muscular LMNA-interacting protein isoform X4 n=1 Tax=Geotrypetes seraphini TaxID=260995 RepID=A0A6P8QGZ4_GEOSA|nr:muscular LMNA-interacting protein isoform X4 [Geotrypetes seraphini]